MRCLSHKQLATLLSTLRSVRELQPATLVPYANFDAVDLISIMQGMRTGGHGGH